MSKLKITNMRNVYVSCFVILLSIAGILHTYIGGGWSTSSGEAAKMYPRAVYVLLILTAAFLLVTELLGKVAFEPAAITMVRLWQVPLLLVLTIGFFELVLYVGLGVSLLAFLLITISLFDEDPKKHLVPNVIVSIVASVALFLVFTMVLPIMTRSQLLI